MTREKTLSDMREDILRAGAWITGGIVVGAALALGFIFMATPFYRAQMIVAPAALMNGPEVASAEDGLSGRTYQIQRGGLNGPGEFLRFENMIGGASVAAKLLQDEKIKRGLEMDKKHGFFEVEQDWSAEKLAEYIDRRVRLEPVGATTLRKMVYLHPSPEFGVYFLHQLHRVTDEMIRAAVKNEAEERVQYLQKATDETYNPEHRKALTNLMMEQERLRMLSSIDQPYAAAVIEPPASSSRARWPDALMIVPMFVFAGALLGFLLHGLFGRGAQQSAEERSIYEQGWYRPESTNTNERKLKRRDHAAE